MSTTPPLFTLVNVADRRTYWVGGQCQAVIVGSADTGGRYALSHSTIAVGGGAAEHAHGREAEAFYVLSGQLAFTFPCDYGGCDATDALVYRNGIWCVDHAAKMERIWW